MLVALSVCKKDHLLAVKLLDWIAELGNTERHELLIAHGASCNVHALKMAGEKAFAKCVVQEMADDIQTAWTDSEHPVSARGANNQFRQIAEYVHYARPDVPFFLYLEPDAFPTRAPWLNELHDDHVSSGKVFSGAIVEKPTPHMCGVSIYPGHIAAYAPSALMAGDAAWDVVASHQIMPQMNVTKLIQQVWLKPEFPRDAAKIDPAACLFHQCKTDSGIQYMRALKNGTPMPATVESGRIGRAILGDYKRVENLVKLVGTGRKIYTYYEPVAQIDRDESNALIALWEAYWLRAGFQPVLISEAHAREHPAYVQAKSLFSKMPSTNPAGYDLHCFLRWLAMSNAGGGIMADYDVMPNGDPQIRLEGDITFYSGNANDPMIPCLVNGTKAGYERAIAHLLAHKPTGNHTSDMVALRDFSAVNHWTCKEVNEEGWEDAEIVHFPTARMQPAGLTPKSRHIPELLKTVQHETETRVFMNGALDGNMPETSEPTTAADYIKALVALASKDGFAKARICKQLAAAGFLPKPTSATSARKASARGTGSRLALK